MLPGMGIFGIGGGLMIIASIVLASQTFVVPTNAYQLRQFPISLLMVAAGMAGGMASIFVIRRFLPDTPYFNRMMLRPPRPEEREALSRRESLVIWTTCSASGASRPRRWFPRARSNSATSWSIASATANSCAKGTPVVVDEVTGSNVVVKRASYA